MNIQHTPLKPVLLTGAHRSGTTWAGRMFSLAPETVYIHEPLNLHHDPALFTARTDNWFTYICSENGSDFLPAFQNIIQLRYNLINRLKHASHRKGIRRALRELFVFAKYRSQHRVPLIKDPIAIFSSEWLASTFDMNTVVLIRHPAAMAASVKAKNWHHPFQHFLNQPLLMRDHLSPFRDEIVDFVDSQHDLVDQAAMLWTMIYTTVLKFQQNHEDWIFVRHEDLARDPLTQYRHLYQRLGLSFTDQVQEQIVAFSKKNQSNEKSNTSLSDLKRDSASTTTNWKSQLTEDEIARVKARVQDVSKHFYGENEWS